jgi:hypothetical protein
MRPTEEREFDVQICIGAARDGPVRWCASASGAYAILLAKVRIREYADKRVNDRERTRGSGNRWGVSTSSSMGTRHVRASSSSSVGRCCPDSRRDSVLIEMPVASAMISDADGVLV